MPRMPVAAAALLAAVLALAACDDPPEGAQSGPEVAAANDTTPAAMEGTIPLALQGRWGINAADCTTTRGDDKGLLVIDGQTLRFYESRATLESVDENADSHLDGVFAFSGEGSTWKRRFILDVQDNGATLVRQDHGDDAQPDPVRYARCPE